MKDNPKTPLRVLCVFSTLDRGGAETMCMNLYRHIDRTEVQFDFVKHTPARGEFEDEIESLGGRVYEAPRHKGYNRPSYLAWWRKHLENHPEHIVVHGHYFTIAFLYLGVAKQMGRKTIAHSHSAEDGGGNSLPKRMLLAEAARKTEVAADVRLACSKAAGEWLYPHSEFTVVNNAVDAERFAFDPLRRERMRAELGLPEGCKALVVVGNLAHVKNPAGVIAICKELNTRLSDWRLLWCGRDGGMRDEVEQWVREAGLSEHVSLLGARGDVDSLLQASDAFLMPSLFEGLPVSAIEAQAAGLPCYLSEAITQEVDVTGLCHFLPLDKWDLWADAIANNDTPRCDTSADLEHAGYDARANAEWFEDFYCGLKD